jgi:hypothetical protein
MKWHCSRVRAVPFIMVPRKLTTKSAVFDQLAERSLQFTHTLVLQWLTKKGPL